MSDDGNRDLLMNLLMATWETAEPMSSSSSDSSSSDDEVHKSEETLEAIAHLTELLQLVQRRSRVRETEAAAMEAQSTNTLSSSANHLPLPPPLSPAKSFKLSGSQSDYPGAALLESSETVSRMRRSYQVQAVACQSNSSFEINRECPQGGVSSLLDHIPEAPIISSRTVSEDVCVVCGLEDKGHYTKRGFKCHNCVPLMDVVDSSLFMRYNPSYGESLFGEEGGCGVPECGGGVPASGSGVLTRTASGTIVRTPSLQRRVTYQQGSVLSASTVRMSQSTSTRVRSRAVSIAKSPSIKSTTTSTPHAPVRRYLSRSDFSKSHQDPDDAQTNAIEQSVATIEDTLRKHFTGKCVHPLNGGLVVEDAGLAVLPATATEAAMVPAAPTPDLSLDSTSLHALVVNGSAAKTKSTSPDPVVVEHPPLQFDNAPARHGHSDWEAIWDNPVRGNDFMRVLPCIRDVHQYDPYGLSFLRSYNDESDRALRLATTEIDKVSQEDSKDALLSLYRDYSSGRSNLAASSPYSCPMIPQRQDSSSSPTSSNIKQDPQSWSTGMYTHVVPKLFTRAGPQQPSGRMGRYMVVKRTGASGVALSNDSLFEGSPLLASLMGGGGLSSTSYGSGGSAPSGSGPTPIHDLHGLVHPNLLYIFAVAPQPSADCTWYVLENLPSLQDYRIVKHLLSATAATTTATPTTTGVDSTIQKSISPNSTPTSEGPHSTTTTAGAGGSDGGGGGGGDTFDLGQNASAFKINKLKSAVSNVMGSFRRARPTSLLDVIQTVMSHLVSRNEDEEFKALSYGAIAAVQAIHKAGFVHGDLRPHNFFVDPATGAVKIRFCPAYEMLPDPFSPPESNISTSSPFKPTPEGDVYTLGVTLRLLRYGTTDSSGYPPANVMLEADRRLTEMLDSMTSLIPSSRPTPARLLEAGPLWVIRTIRGVPAVRKLVTVNLLTYQDQVSFASSQHMRSQPSPQLSFAGPSRHTSFKQQVPVLARESTLEFKMPNASRLYLRESVVSSSTANMETSPGVEDDGQSTWDAQSEVQEGLERSFHGSMANLTAYRRIGSVASFALLKSDATDESLEDSLNCSLNGSAMMTDDAVFTNQLQRVVIPASALTRSTSPVAVGQIRRKATSPESSNHTTTPSASSTSSSPIWYQDPAQVASAPVFILRNVNSKGAQELLKFFAVCGPSYHAVRGGDGFLALYSVLKDPRSTND